MCSLAELSFLSFLCFLKQGLVSDGFFESTFSKGPFFFMAEKIETGKHSSCICSVDLDVFLFCLNQATHLQLPFSRLASPSQRCLIVCLMLYFCTATSSTFFLLFGSVSEAMEPLKPLKATWMRLSSFLNSTSSLPLALPLSPSVSLSPFLTHVVELLLDAPPAFIGFVEAFAQGLCGLILIASDIVFFFFSFVVKACGIHEVCTAVLFSWWHTATLQPVLCLPSEWLLEAFQDSLCSGEWHSVHLADGCFLWENLLQAFSSSSFFSSTLSTCSLSLPHVNPFFFIFLHSSCFHCVCQGALSEHSHSQQHWQYQLFLFHLMWCHDYVMISSELNGNGFLAKHCLWGCLCASMQPVSVLCFGRPLRVFVLG